jgi:hypothetical protein
VLTILFGLSGAEPPWTVSEETDLQPMTTTTCLTSLIRPSRRIRKSLEEEEVVVVVVVAETVLQEAMTPPPPKTTALSVAMTLTARLPAKKGTIFGDLATMSETAAGMKNLTLLAVRTTRLPSTTTKAIGRMRSNIQMRMTVKDTMIMEVTLDLLLGEDAVARPEECLQEDSWAEEVLREDLGLREDEDLGLHREVAHLTALVALPGAVRHQEVSATEALLRAGTAPVSAALEWALLQA